LPICDCQLPICFPLNRQLAFGNVCLLCSPLIADELGAAIVGATVTLTGRDTIPR
jgi:hypothetical protein